MTPPPLGAGSYSYLTFWTRACPGPPTLAPCQRRSFSLSHFLTQLWHWLGRLVPSLGMRPRGCLLRGSAMIRAARRGPGCSAFVPCVRRGNRMGYILHALCHSDACLDGPALGG